MPTPEKSYTERDHAYYHANKERISKQRKEYRDSNKEHCNELQRQTRERNRESRREQAKRYYRENIEARRAASNKRYKENPDRFENNRLKRKYGITLQQYGLMFSSQGERCAICRCTQVSGGHPWHLDHDHLTGKVRGILCRYCNLMIGHAKDNTDTLHAAIAYLIDKPA